MSSKVFFHPFVPFSWSSGSFITFLSTSWRIMFSGSFGRINFTNFEAFKSSFCDRFADTRMSGFSLMNVVQVSSVRPHSRARSAACAIWSGAAIQSTSLIIPTFMRNFNVWLILIIIYVHFSLLLIKSITNV